MRGDLVAGIVLNHRFHQSGRWVVPTCTPHLVDAIMSRFHCLPINDQREFDQHYDEVDFLISMEPGWAAPILDFRSRFWGIPTRTPKLTYILYSDPHIEQWREAYFLRNRLSFVLALYYQPTLYHFRRIPQHQIVHFPWAIPDDYITTGRIVHHGAAHIACYGASQGEAYEVRNWCRTFDFVLSTSYSGVENRQLTDKQLFSWLATQDAAIAAGSDSPKYRLTMPKYFELPASGALLFAQETDDLERLGFKDMVNCVVFNRENFAERAQAYLADPAAYLPIREQGRELIRSRHSLSVRLDWLEQHVREYLQ